MAEAVVHETEIETVHCHRCGIARKKHKKCVVCRNRRKAANAAEHTNVINLDSRRNSRAGRRERDALIASQYAAGDTLASLAEKHGLTRQRIHQILVKRGVPRRPRGGWGNSAPEIASQYALERELKCLREWGVSVSEYERLRGLGVTQAYTRQRLNVAHQVSPDAWRLTFPEWWAIWRTSGQWSERGRGRIGLVRIDTGRPFEVGNVKIGSPGRGRQK